MRWINSFDPNIKMSKRLLILEKETKYDSRAIVKKKKERKKKKRNQKKERKTEEDRRKKTLERKKVKRYTGS